MNVNYINVVMTDDCARCTFIGRDATGKLRRPVIDLDSTDLAGLIAVAKAFRKRQRDIAARHAARAQRISDEGVAE